MDQALESGDFKKGRMRLVRKEGKRGNRYCCLGVLCKTERMAAQDMRMESLTHETRRRVGLSHNIEVALIHLNDEHTSFEPVVKYLKDHFDSI